MDITIALQTAGKTWNATLKAGQHTKQVSGSAETQHSVELQAIHDCLKLLKSQGHTVQVQGVKDKYVLDGINTWMSAWEKDGWRKKKGGEVANKELWADISQIAQSNQVIAKREASKTGGKTIALTGQFYVTHSMRDYIRRAVQKAKAEGHTLVTGDGIGVDKAVAEECAKQNVLCVVAGLGNTPVNGIYSANYVKVDKQAFLAAGGQQRTNIEVKLAWMSANSTLLVYVTDQRKKDLPEALKQARCKVHVAQI